MSGFGRQTEVNVTNLVQRIAELEAAVKYLKEDVKMLKDRQPMSLMQRIFGRNGT